MEEIYKDIIGFEGKYQVSNFGNVRTIERITICKDGRKCHYKGKVLICSPNNKGYLTIRLENYIKGIGKTKTIHSLVWEAFGDNSKIYFPDKVIDHIDRNKHNNHINNLRVISNRENASNRKDNKEFIGVRKNNKSDNYTSRIWVNNKEYHIGTFKTIEEAYVRYNEALLHIDTDFLQWYETIETPKKSISIDSKIGVHKGKTNGTYRSSIAFKSKTYTLGTFKSELEARQIFLEAKTQIKNGTFLEWYETLGVKRK